MEEQLSLIDFLEALEEQEQSESDPTKILTEKDLPFLWDSLLIETIKSAFGLSRGGRKRQSSMEAWAWILSEKEDLPFSFSVCCKQIGVDPDTMLNSLEYYRRKFLS
ncbi:MAG: hypothetical protein JKY09_07705 [Crocinitomicaceae bacterium]|nr:hypothetical protein [Crocinitomicaceae bacterium]